MRRGTRQHATVPASTQNCGLRWAAPLTGHAHGRTQGHNADARTTLKGLHDQLHAQVKLLRSSYNACQEFAVYVADIYGVCYPLNPLERKE